MMRYCAIDLETTGLSPERHQVLELACVIESACWRMPVDELPRFRALVNPGTEIRGDAFALNMNARLLAELAANPHTPNLGAHLIDLGAFIHDNLGEKSVTIAGKNFGAFDAAFLGRCPEWKFVKHKHRYIDAGNLWWEPGDDACLPDLAACQQRAGVAARTAHSALDDCLAVIELVRAKYARQLVRAVAA